MLILASANDKLQVVLSALGTINVHCSYLDNVSGSVVPGRQNTVVTSGTADVVAPPDAGVFRNLKTLHAYNAGSAANDVTVQHTDGTLAVELHRVTLPAGATLQYIDEVGFAVPEAKQIPVGTRMLFQQTTAPLGWTKDTTQNDKALRVVSGSAGTGGVQPFSALFGRTATDPFTLTANETAYHAHSVYDPTHAHGVADYQHFHYYPYNTLTIDFGYIAVAAGDFGQGYYNMGWYGNTNYNPANVAIYGAYTGIGIYGAGGSQPHSHGLDLRVLYVDVIIATKN